MFMLKYFRGYHRPMKINQNEYLTHELFSHENFPIYGVCVHAYLLVHVYVHAFAFVYMCVCTCSYVCVCVSVYRCVHVCNSNH